MKKQLIILILLTWAWTATAAEPSRVSNLSWHEVACQDSDNGNNPQTAGGVQLLSREGSILKTYSDQCLPDNKLLENYCENGLHQSAVMACRCEKNACVTPQWQNFWKKILNFFKWKKKS